MLHWLRKPLVYRIGVFVAIWAVGAFGFEASRDISNPVDSVYRALQMFALNYEVPEHEPFYATTGLLISRFVAAGFAIYALLSLLSRNVSSFIVRVKQAICGKQIILLGFGNVNRLLAEALSNDGKDVMIVDTSFDAASLAMARLHGYLLVEADLTDQKARRNLWPSWASRVIVACGNDATNLKIGTDFARLIDAQHRNHSWLSRLIWGAPERIGYDRAGNPIVKVHISSPKFMHDLNSSEDYSVELGNGMSFFSLKTTTARVLVERARFLQRARDLGQDRPHIVIVGGGELAEAILCDVIHACIENATTPKMTLLVSKKDAVQARFAARYPHLFDETLPKDAQPDISFETADPATLDFDNDPLIAQLENLLVPPTAWVFANRVDEVNLEASLRLEVAMYKQRRRHVPVFCRIWQGDVVPLRQRQNFGISEIFGQRSDPQLQSRILEQNPDWLAKKIHLAYGDDKAGQIAREQEAEGGLDSAPFMMMWQQLPQNGHRANRAAGVHLPQKIAGLGFNWKSADRGVLPVVPQGSPAVVALERAMAMDQDADLPPEINAIAETEHLRWMIDRALNGWKQDDTRANRRHLHPNLVSYVDLDNPTRRLDLTALAMAINMKSLEFPSDSPHAFMREVKEYHVANLAGQRAPAGTTDVSLMFRTDGDRLTNKELDALSQFIRQFAELPSACRIHFVVAGKADFLVERTLKIRGRAFVQERIEIRSLLEWLTEAVEHLPQDILVDITYLPDA